MVYNGNLSQSTAQELDWVNRTYQNMTPDERLGQLFMIRAHSDLGPDHVAAVERQINDYHIGGLCFFQGTPEDQLALTNQYQNLSKLPLLVSMDAEWGLGMRLKETTISFPKQLALGAIRDNRLIYDMGTEIARQMNRLGVNVSFSPVLDVNNNPDNPVIGTRSFGEDRYNVTVKGYMYMKGLQDHGVMACAKHFPGHGDTDVDSHKDLPIINHSRARLDSIELYPFRALSRYGIGSVMVAHLNIPTLDSRENRPTTLSRAVTTDLLRNEVGFHGLAFTDAMEMKGVTKYFSPGAADAEALLAGNDMILLPEDIAASFVSIRNYLADGRLKSAQLEASVKRILLAKYRLGLTGNYPTLAAANLRQEINAPAAYELKQRLHEASLTLVRDDAGILPIGGDLSTLKLAAIAVGGDEVNPPYQERLAGYAGITRLKVGLTPSAAETARMLERTAGRDVVLVSLHSSGSSSQEKIQVNNSLLAMLRQLQQRTKIVITIFGNPYTLAKLDEFGSVMVAYTNDPVAQDAAAQAIFGAIGMDGRLPVNASKRSTYNSGLVTRKNFRMGYAPPERVGMFSDTLYTYIDNLAHQAIAEHATPGMTVLVARQGKIVLEKAYGYHTYDNKLPVRTDDLYDLASVTKVAATTLSLMKLFEEGRFEFTEPLSKYLTVLRGTNKENLLIGDILAHRAGLLPWIPFYTATLSGTKRKKVASTEFYRSIVGGSFNVPVTEKLFLKDDYREVIQDQILTSKVRPPGAYRYSDLGFYLMADLVKELSGETVDVYVAKNFYRPLGLSHLTYLPLRYYSKTQIVPSEKDAYWRKQIVQGYVHDMGAAMLGGVSGHAGLFGNARDLAVVFQLLLQNGTYGGRTYLQPATVAAFTHRFSGESRRGYGFDLKQLNPERKLNMSPLASDLAFGHLGFTGTAVWADPQEDLVFVFLSNRTFPDMRNQRISRLGTRPLMQSAAYRAINPGASIDRLNKLYLPTT